MSADGGVSRPAPGLLSRKRFVVFANKTRSDDGDEPFNRYHALPAGTGRSRVQPAAFRSDGERTDEVRAVSERFAHLCAIGNFLFCLLFLCTLSLEFFRRFVCFFAGTSACNLGARRPAFSRTVSIILLRVARYVFA